MNDAIRMQLSAFVDGELPQNEAELLLRRMSQDAELRQDVAEYLAMGRFVRGEAGLAGADRLHQRVAAQIDDPEQHNVFEDVVSPTGRSRALRPIAGIAIAAAVAVVAVFSLQQAGVVDTADEDVSASVATTESPMSTPVPTIDVQEERQRQYFRSHAETSTAFGANSMNSRVVSLRLSEELVEESRAQAASAEESTDESDLTVTNPE